MALDDWYFRISLLVFLVVVKKLWDVLYTFWLGPAMNTVDIKSYGKWAMVTGSTDGIGKEYARQLAARGCNIILVSRTLQKLKDVAREIEKEFNVDTKIVQIDFTGDVSIYNKLAKEIQGLEIGTLVNNVGLAYPYLELFLDLPDWSNFMKDLINLNIVSMVRVTGLVLPGMVKRDKGIIINISSSCYDVPAPYLMVYAATKAFIAKFSEGLFYEYGSKSLIIQTLAPSVISTKMSGIDVNLAVPSAEKFVTSALSMLGSVHNSSGYFIHSCGSLLVNIAKFVSENSTKCILRKIAELSRIMQLKKLKIKIQ